MKYKYYIFSDAIVSQVLDELGLQLTDELSGTLICSSVIQSN